MSGAAAALSGAPDSIRRSVTDLGKVVELLAAQKQQIEQLLGISDEYLTAVRNAVSFGYRPPAVDPAGPWASRCGR